MLSLVSGLRRLFCLMSFDEFSKHGFTVLSMFEFSKRVKETICLMSFDEFSKLWLTLLSMFEFSKRVKETILFDVIR
jgi:uncharacterized protein YbgA (DUF1722 family)